MGVCVVMLKSTVRFWSYCHLIYGIKIWHFLDLHMEWYTCVPLTAWFCRKNLLLDLVLGFLKTSTSVFPHCLCQLRSPNFRVCYNIANHIILRRLRASVLKTAVDQHGLLCSTFLMQIWIQKWPIGVRFGFILAIVNMIILAPDADSFWILSSRAPRNCFEHMALWPWMM